MVIPSDRSRRSSVALTFGALLLGLILLASFDLTRSVMATSEAVVQRARMTPAQRAEAERDVSRRALRAQAEIVVVLLGGALLLAVVGLATQQLLTEISELKRTDHGSSEQVALLHAVIDGTADLVSLKDLTGRYRMVNAAFARAVGRTPEQVVGRLDHEVLPQDSLTPMHESDTEVVQSGRLISFEETRIIDGYARTFLSTKTLQRRVDGTAVGIIGVARDITDRIRAETELKDSEQRLRALNHASPVGIWRSDARGRCNYVNPQWQKMTGLSFDQSLVDGWLDAVHPDDRAVAREALQRETADESDPVTELRFVRAGGDVRWVRLHGAPIFAPAGEITGFVGTADDITERRLAEESLRQLNHRLEQQRQELRMLSEMSELLQACQNREEVYPIATQALQRLFPGTGGWIGTISPSRNAVEQVLEWGPRDPDADTFSPGECWALRRGKAHHVRHAGDAPRCGHLPADPARGYVCIPMIAQGEALGVLHVRPLDSPGVAHHGSSAPIADEVGLQLVISAAEHVGPALANVELRETLRNQSIRDPLSGVYNRRFMEESLEREAQRAQRKGSPIGLIMLDLDHFKRFNDTYGHEAGDAIIRALGSFLQARVRASDIVCRYGGEEFVIILPETGADQTTQRATLLCTDLRKTSFKVDDTTLGPITLSAGVAVLPDHASNASELLRAADTALYRAKDEGRDRVSVALPATTET